MKTGKKGLKLAALLFALVFAAGTAFAATNGVLAFGGTVRINSVATIVDARLEFVNLSASPWDESVLSVTNSISNSNDGISRLQFDVEIRDPVRFLEIVNTQVSTPAFGFTVQNTGNVPVRFLGRDDDTFTTAHSAAGVTLRNGTDQVFFTQGLYHEQAQRLGVIAPGQALEGDVFIGSIIIGYYNADGTTTFSFFVELPYEQVR
ncbi:MAG: hypothetical protein FWD03_03635 [Defluviitaleaceae bacterium]|nr:hypothetical protein [Defluviitaleaceae bacterium]